MDFIVQQQIGGYYVDIFCGIRKAGVLLNLEFNGEELVEREVNVAEIAKPLLRLPYQHFTEFVKEVAKYAKENKIEVEEENHLKGKLEVTEMYLNDLRKSQNKLMDHLLKSKNLIR